MLTGVYLAYKKNGDMYFRSSITFNNKHISLGSFQTEKEANKAYNESFDILFNNLYCLVDYSKEFTLSFNKWVVLHNYRDNKIYFKNPIYLKPNYFVYYLDINTELKFDVDDLFFYSTHKIMQRGGYLFVSDYGMQINILSKYGIKNFSVLNKDYFFINGDYYDFRYSNISIINKYYGVTKVSNNGNTCYLSKIHVNGDIIIGRYTSEIDAAIAYNKAGDILKEKGCNKDFFTNYINEINEIEYAKIYNLVRVSKKIRGFFVG